MTTFPDWITKKYLGWQAQKGERKTIDDFAAYVGVSRPLMNMWMNGDKPRPGSANIKMLAEIFGDEIYDVLELPRPNPYLQKINKIFEHLSPDHQKLLAEEAERYEAQNHEENVRTTSKQRKKRTSQ